MGKKGKGKGKVVDPAVAAAEARRKQLVEKADALAAAASQEEQRQAAYEREKTMTNHAWVAERESLRRSKHVLRAKEAQLGKLRDEAEGEVSVQKQKLKHLLLEQRETYVRARYDDVVLDAQADAASQGKEGLVRADARALKKTRQGFEIDRDALFVDVKRRHDASLYGMRMSFEQLMRDKQRVYEAEARSMRSELEARRTVDVAEVERRKRAHTERLIGEHAAGFRDIKAYFVSITHSNLDLIKQLKTDVGAAVERQRLDEADIRKVEKDNARMELPLRRGQADVKTLTAELEVWQRDMDELMALKGELLALNRKFKGKHWEKEVVSQKLLAAQEENAALVANYGDAVAQLAQRNNFRTLVVEKKFEHVAQATASSEAQLRHVLTNVANLQPVAVAQFTGGGGGGDVLAATVAKIAAARARLEESEATYAMVKAACESKLEQLGSRFDELGTVPDVLAREAPEAAAASTMRGTMAQTSEVRLGEATAKSLGLSGTMAGVMGRSMRGAVL